MAIYEKMKKIVHITSVHSAFDSRILYRECRWLAGKGYEVFLIAPSSFSYKKVDDVHILGVRKYGARSKRFLTWLHILIKVCGLKPDLVHFHDPELLVIVPLLKMLNRNKIKIIYDVHEYFIESIKDKIWIPQGLKKITAFFVSFCESFFGRWVDAQIFVVSGQLPYYSDWNTLKIIVHNYPDPDEFKMDVEETETDKVHAKFTLVHIGSLYERRGIMTMLKALRLLTEQGYDDVCFILGGVFESKLFRHRVDTFINCNYLQSNVKIAGWIDYPVINKYFAHADAVWIALYPLSQYLQQNISTKQLEAMAASLPVVCSDLPSLTRFIDKASCGISVPAEDPAAHADAIKFLYHNRDKAREMGLRGRQLIMEKFNWQHEAELLSNFYAALLK